MLPPCPTPATIENIDYNGQNYNIFPFIVCTVRVGSHVADMQHETALLKAYNGKIMAQNHNFRHSPAPWGRGGIPQGVPRERGSSQVTKNKG